MHAPLNLECRILLKAIELIDAPEKWSKGQSWTNDGKMCIGYAYYQAIKICAENDQKEFLYIKFEKEFNKQEKISSIVAFNDAPDRTHEEVMAALNKLLQRRINGS